MSRHRLCAFWFCFFLWRLRLVLINSPSPVCDGLHVGERGYGALTVATGSRIAPRRMIFGGCGFSPPCCSLLWCSGDGECCFIDNQYAPTSVSNKMLGLVMGNCAGFRCHRQWAGSNRVCHPKVVRVPWTVAVTWLVVRRNPPPVKLSPWDGGVPSWTSKKNCLLSRFGAYMKIPAGSDSEPAGVVISIVTYFVDVSL